MSQPLTHDNLPLPHGWIEQVDAQTNHVFYVDTKATPPRSIWVHPYEDEQFLREHPEIRKTQKLRGGQGPSDSQGPPPPYSRRHSYGGRSSSPQRDVALGTSTPGASPKKRGFFDKMKDKAIASLEEKQQRQRAAMEQRRMYQQQYAAPQYGFQQQYAAPQYGYPQRMAMGRRGGFGGGGMALPLLGGLAGGMLLGDMMDGGLVDGGYGGDYGGGDFGGGDFGGF